MNKIEKFAYCKLLTFFRSLVSLMLSIIFAFTNIPLTSVYAIIITDNTLQTGLDVSVDEINAVNASNESRHSIDDDVIDIELEDTSLSTEHEDKFHEEINPDEPKPDNPDQKLEFTESAEPKLNFLCEYSHKKF